MIYEKCSVDGCPNQGKLHRNGYRFFPRGFCNTHYKKWAKNNRDIIEYRVEECSVEGCNHEGPFKKGMCTKHYARFMKHGDVEYVEKRREGQTKHCLYSTYNGMIRRCTDEKYKDFKNYGANGVYVCERWSGVNRFFNFIEDMGDRPDGHSLDRINPLEGYCKDNCRWADKFTQALNKRNVKNRGVIYYPELNRYRARITINRENFNLGWFDNVEDAIIARKEGELKLLGYIINE